MPSSVPVSCFPTQYKVKRSIYCWPLLLVLPFPPELLTAPQTSFIDLSFSPLAGFNAASIFCHSWEIFSQRFSPVLSKPQKNMVLKIPLSAVQLKKVPLHQPESKGEKQAPDFSVVVVWAPMSKCSATLTINLSKHQSNFKKHTLLSRHNFHQLLLITGFDRKHRARFSLNHLLDRNDGMP